ncbi:MAG: hypothetical protein K8F91_24690 [Candidatus Obscuribacterales bacterium]|nr:hypothetical protein [Candidatus Obscuribacterales bacterium]
MTETPFDGTVRQAWWFISNEVPEAFAVSGFFVLFPYLVYEIVKKEEMKKGAQRQF